MQVKRHTYFRPKKGRNVENQLDQQSCHFNKEMCFTSIAGSVHPPTLSLNTSHFSIDGQPSVKLDCVPILFTKLFIVNLQPESYPCPFYLLIHVFDRSPFFMLGQIRQRPALTKLPIVTARQKCVEFTCSILFRLVNDTKKQISVLSIN